MKIETLTEAQFSRFPLYVEKWTRIGLSTDSLDDAKVKSALNGLFNQVKKQSPKYVRCTSPLAALLTRSVLASVSASVRDSVLASVRASVRASVLASVRDSVRASVSASVLASVRDSVSASVRASVLASVRDSVRASVSASVSDWYYWEFGQYASYWLSFYDFMSAELKCDTSPLIGNFDFCKEAGYSLLFWDLALVSEKPRSITRNNRGQLHRDLAPALEHSDGFAIYALNGVRMKPEQVLTPAEKMSPESVLAETNVDIRRELIRKMGVERMLSKLPHKVLEKRNNYELLSVKLSEGVKDARYLKMINPSIKVFHIEGVSPECDTVEKSLNFRNSNWHTDAEILT